MRDDQELEVTNASGGVVTVRVGHRYQATLAPNASHTFAVPFGSYLVPGVHRLAFTDASAADIWLDPVCAGPGAADCSAPTTTR